MSVAISKVEYVTNVMTGSTLNGTAPNAVTTFSLQQFNDNAGLLESFPWSATIANNFTKYRRRKMKIHYVPTSANALNSTNTALGVVMLRIQADPTFAVDTDETQMENGGQFVVGDPTKALTLEVRCDGAKRTIRQGPYVGDLRMYDQVYFEIATQGMQAANITIGKLYIEHETEFFNPLYIQGQYGGTVLEDLFRCVNVPTPTAALPLNGTSANSGNTIGCTIDNSGTNSNVIFPVSTLMGKYLIEVTVFSATTWTAGSWSVTTNPYCNVITLYTPNTANIDGGTSNCWVAPQSGVTGTNSAALTFLLSVTAPGQQQASFTLANSAWTAGNSSVGLRITQANQNLT